jgi:hypothetical protein
MKNTTMLPLLLALVALSSGCATVIDPAMSAGDGDVDVSKEAMLFMTVRISNQFKPSFQPRIVMTVARSEDAQKEKLTLKADKPYSATATHEEYLLSFKLQPGQYRVRYILAKGTVFPITGTFFVPIFQTIEVKGPGAYYLGRIDATVVERTDAKQFRAGSVIPLAAQRAAGAAGGTFIVKIEDQLDHDLRTLGPTYPALTKLSVTKSLLGPWTPPTEAEMELLK